MANHSKHNHYPQSLHINLHQPIFANLLTQNKFCWGLIGATTLHGLAVLSGNTLYECPLLTTTGIPCPGCGLSRGMQATLYGDWDQLLAYHAFAPFFLLAIVLTVGITALPSHMRRPIIQWIETRERLTGFSAIFLILFVFYWLARLAIFQTLFINLILLY